MTTSVTKEETSRETRVALVEAELETLYQVSQVLSRSLNLHDTLQEVLKILNDSGRLRTGMVSLLDEETGELMVSALHDDDFPPSRNVRYRPGEGIVGLIMARAASMSLAPS